MQSEGATPSSMSDRFGKYASKFSSRLGSGHSSSIGSNEGAVDGAGGLEQSKKDDTSVWKISSAKISSFSHAVAAQASKLDSLVESSLFNDGPTMAIPKTLDKQAPPKKQSTNNLPLARGDSDDTVEGADTSPSSRKSR